MTATAIYARISSTDSKVDKVENQIKDCRALAEREGYTVGPVFKDDGITGTDASVTRSGFDDLMAAVKRGEVSLVLATEEERLARNIKDKIDLMAACVDAGVTWHTIRDGRLDPANPGDEFLGGLRALMGKQEVSRMKARQRARYDARLAEGLPLWGRRPFGFQADGITHEPVEALHVVEAADAVLAGDSLRSIARSLNERGVTTAKNKKGEGGKPWAPQSLKKMLLRPRNVGDLVHRGEVVARDAFPGILDRAAWENMKAILTAPARQTGGGQAVTFLSSIAMCGVCGSPMFGVQSRDGRSGKVSPIYRCTSRAMGYPTYDPTDTRRHPAPRQADLDRAVMREIAGILMTGHRSLGASASASKLAHVSKEMEALKARREGLKGLLGPDTGLTYADFRPDFVDIQNQMDSLETARQQTLAEDVKLQVLEGLRRDLFAEKRVSLDDAGEVTKQIRERLEALPLEKRRRLAKDLVSITVNPGRGAHRFDVEWL